MPIESPDWPILLSSTLADDMTMGLDRREREMERTVIIHRPYGDLEVRVDQQDRVTKWRLAVGGAWTRADAKVVQGYVDALEDSFANPPAQDEDEDEDVYDLRTAPLGWEREASADRKPEETLLVGDPGRLHRIGFVSAHGDAEAQGLTHEEAHAAGLADHDHDPFANSPAHDLTVASVEAREDPQARLIAAAQDVIRRWESGNLAEAVNVLGGVLYDLDAYPEDEDTDERCEHDITRSEPCDFCEANGAYDEPGDPGGDEDRRRDLHQAT